MLDIHLLRTQPDHIARVLAARNYVFPLAEFSALEAERKNLQTCTQELQARRNAASMGKDARKQLKKAERTVREATADVVGS